MVAPCSKCCAFVQKIKLCDMLSHVKLSDAVAFLGHL